MEKVVKENQITTTVKETVYVAYDDTEFNTEADCKKYENACKLVILNKLESCTIKTLDYDPFGECDDVYCKIISPKTDEDIDNLNIIDGICNYTSKLRFSPKDLGKLIFVYYRIDNSVDCLWFQYISNIIETYTNKKFEVVETDYDDDIL